MHAFSFRITKPTNTYSDYVILIAFALQQWLHESASFLCYEYIDSFVVNQLCVSVYKQLMALIPFILLSTEGVTKEYPKYMTHLDKKICLKIIMAGCLVVHLFVLFH